jgi:nucleoid-associated protein EbfC
MNLNIQDMLAKVQEMQARMSDAQKQLQALKKTVEVGGGMVSVTINGKQEISKIAIDKTVVDPNDVGMLEDLIVSAVNKAIEESHAMAQEEMGKATTGMLPNLPGLDLGNLGL